MDSFLNFFTEKMEKHAPIKTKSNKALTLNDRPCISRPIRQSIKIRGELDKQRAKKQKSKIYINSLKHAGTTQLR